MNNIKWIKIEFGNSKYFNIFGSGIDKFQGEKEYLSTSSIIFNEIKEIESTITFENRQSRANMQPALDSVWFAKMKETVKVYSFTEKNEDEISKYILSTGFLGIKCFKNISVEYVKYFLLSKYFNNEKDKLTSGSTQSALNNTEARKLKIPLPFSNGEPDLELQQQIVKKLELAEQLKENRKNADELTKNYLNSVFLEMFGDPRTNPKGFEMKRLENLGNSIGGGTPSRKNNEYFNGNIPWITTVSLGEIYIDEDNAIEYISSKAIEESSTKLIPKNSLIIGTRVGVGKISINKCELCTNQDITSLVNIDLERNNLIFLYYIIKTLNKYFESEKRGATIQGITGQQLRNLQIPLPLISLQNQFAKIVEEVETLKEYQEKSREEIENLYNKLLQDAFRGEI